VRICFGERFEELSRLYTGFLEKCITFNWIISRNLTKNSVRSDTFFPESLYKWCLNSPFHIWINWS